MQHAPHARGGSGVRACFNRNDAVDAGGVCSPSPTASSRLKLMPFGNSRWCSGGGARFFFRRHFAGLHARENLLPARGGRGLGEVGIQLIEAQIALGFFRAVAAEAVFLEEGDGLRIHRGRGRCGRRSGEFSRGGEGENREGNRE